jgi:hypothetical protein
VGPGLRYDAGRLDEHRPVTEPSGDGDSFIEAKGVPLRRESIELLDAVLGVAAVETHVPLPHRARRARHRIGAAHDTNDEVVGSEWGARRRLEDPSKRLVAEHEEVTAGWRRPVCAADDLAVGPAHAHDDAADEQLILLGRRVGQPFEARRTGGAGLHGQRPHHDPPPSGERDARPPGPVAGSCSSLRRCPGPPLRARLWAVLISGTCEKACGKLPI